MKIKLTLALIAAICVPNLSYAGEAFLKYGAGIGNSRPALIASVGGQRTFDIPYAIQEVEAGYWHDAMRKGAGYGTWAYGIKVESKEFYMLTTIGLAALTATDSLLGGNFQFTEQACGGIRDALGVNMGVCYRHISSAGIYPVNIGRDFLTLRIGVSF